MPPRSVLIDQITGLAELALGLGERLFTIAAASRAIAAILNEHAEKFHALPGAKDYVLFDEQTAASLHCQTGALALSNQVMFDWLDDQLLGES